jgi:hypothetical protein
MPIYNKRGRIHEKENSKCGRLGCTYFEPFIGGYQKDCGCKHLIVKFLHFLA